MDSEWDPVQVGYLVASKTRESDVGWHGVPMSVASDSKNPPRVDVDVYVDHVAKAVRAKEEQYKRDYPNDRNKDGWVFVPRIVSEIGE